MRLLRYLKILKDEEIARRYFVMNSFDGTLTILGIVIAMYMAGKHDASLVIISSLGAAIALAVSGVWSAYATERAERLRSLRELEMHLLKDLNGTEIEKKMSMMTMLIALVNGLSPLLVSFIIISPLLISQFGLIGVETAFYFSFISIVLILFLLGAFIGKIARENYLKSGFKMLLAGIVVGIIVYILEFVKVL